jgi:hypothetical protein
MQLTHDTRAHSSHLRSLVVFVFGALRTRPVQLSPEVRPRAEYVPEPPGFAYSACAPRPVTVPRGTAQFFTQSMLHASWANIALDVKVI